MANHIINMFLRFGEEEHVRDLFENGTIYMNSIQHFRLMEDDFLRGDGYEGISKITNYLPGKVEIPELNFTGNHLGVQLREHYEEVAGNIYSLYCISSYTVENPLEFSIDYKNTSFGSHCLMIKDNVEFLSRIENALQLLELNYRHGFVEYYDKDKYNGRVSLFQKIREYSYQREFRFYVERDSIEPLVFKIGSLETLSEVYKAEEIIKGLGLTFKSAAAE